MHAHRDRRSAPAGWAAALLCLAAISAPPPAAATKASPMFLMCYERLKQTVGLIVVQGGDVDEVEDDPDRGRYRVVIYQLSGNKEIRCLPGGDMTVEAAAEAPAED